MKTDLSRHAWADPGRMIFDGYFHSMSDPAGLLGGVIRCICWQCDNLNQSVFRRGARLCGGEWSASIESRMSETETNRKWVRYRFCRRRWL